LLNRPELIRALFGKILKGFQTGAYAPLPHRVYPLDEAVKAFRFMSRGRHIGKLVFTHQLDEVAVRPRSRERVVPDASYLVSGGLGEVALAIAAWLVDQGARHLVLMGHSDPCPEIAGAIERLREKGAEVKVVSADVCDAERVARVLDDIGGAMP